jgi:hypothetical protein
MNASFPDYVTLLGRFLERHREICAEIEGRLLNVQGKPIARTRDRAAFQQAGRAAADLRRSARGTAS